MKNAQDNSKPINKKKMESGGVAGFQSHSWFCVYDNARPKESRKALGRTGRSPGGASPKIKGRRLPWRNKMAPMKKRSRYRSIERRHPSSTSATAAQKHSSAISTAQSRGQDVDGVSSAGLLEVKFSSETEARLHGSEAHLPDHRPLSCSVSFETWHLRWVFWSWATTCESEPLSRCRYRNKSPGCSRMLFQHTQPEPPCLL